MVWLALIKKMVCLLKTFMKIFIFFRSVAITTYEFTSNCLPSGAVFHQHVLPVRREIIGLLSYECQPNPGTLRLQKLMCKDVERCRA